MTGNERPFDKFFVDTLERVRVGTKALNDTISEIEKLRDKGPEAVVLGVGVIVVALAVPLVKLFEEDILGIVMLAAGGIAAIAGAVLLLTKPTRDAEMLFKIQALVKEKQILEHTQKCLELFEKDERYKTLDPAEQRDLLRLPSFTQPDDSE